MRKVMLVGATGLVGRAVVAHSGEQSLTILARQGPDASYPPHLQMIVQPTDQWSAVIGREKPDVLINCLGTTIKQAGSRAALYAVDHDLVLRVATAAKVAGATHMISVSSVGASARSSNFYLKTKGEVEDALRSLAFDRFDILRPGLLIGDRHGPARFGESLAMLAAPFADALLHGGLRRYRSISAAMVAKATIALASDGGTGIHIHENDSMAALAD